MCVGACTRAHVILFPLEVGGDFLMLFIVICVCLCGFSGHSTIQVILVFKCVRARSKCPHFASRRPFSKSKNIHLKVFSHFS
uniref:Uncharacterized protein n=1 Tax=Takifugu rubripes TaxID=31033 RepID=A0A3B5K1J7_TAKRU